jgi:hypothetical protein
MSTPSTQEDDDYFNIILNERIFNIQKNLELIFPGDSLKDQKSKTENDVFKKSFFDNICKKLGFLLTQGLIDSILQIDEEDKSYVFGFNVTKEQSEAICSSPTKEIKEFMEYIYLKIKLYFYLKRIFENNKYREYLLKNNNSNLPELKKWERNIDIIATNLLSNKINIPKLEKYIKLFEERDQDTIVLCKKISSLCGNNQYKCDEQSILSVEEDICNMVIEDTDDTDIDTQLENLFEINDGSIFVKVVNFIEGLKIDEIIKSYFLKKNNDIVRNAIGSRGVDRVEKYKNNLRKLLDKELLKQSLKVFEEKNTENLFLLIIQLIGRFEKDKNLRSYILSENNKLIDNYRKDEDIDKYKRELVKLLGSSDAQVSLQRLTKDRSDKTKITPDTTKETIKKILESSPPTSPKFFKGRDPTKELLKKIPSPPTTPKIFKGRDPTKILLETIPSPPTTPELPYPTYPGVRYFTKPTPPKPNPYKNIGNVVSRKEGEGFTYLESEGERSDSE